MYLRQIRVAGCIFTPGVPPLTHVSTALRLRLKTSARAFGGSTESRRMAANSAAIFVSILL